VHSVASQDRVELANAAYGQAEVLVTPLQMALVAATIANHGVEMQPKLVDYLQTADGNVTNIGSQPLSQVCDSGTAAIIGQAMVQAVEGQYGKAFAGAAAVPGITTAGKSGTAQLGRERGTAQLVHRLRTSGRAQDRDRRHRRGRRRRRTARRAHGRRADEPVSGRQPVIGTYLKGRA